MCRFVKKKTERIVSVEDYLVSFRGCQLQYLGSSLQVMDSPLGNSMKQLHLVFSCTQYFCINHEFKTLTRTLQL